MIASIVTFFRWFLGEPLTPKNKEPKDPLDMTRDERSTGWREGDHVCVTCKMKRSDAEHDAKICDGCGGWLSHRFANWPGTTWKYRRIWDGEKWMWQYITGNSFTWLPKAGWFSEEPRHVTTCKPNHDPDICKETNYRK